MVWSQLYIKGVGSPDIDHYQSETDSIYGLGNYEEATIGYDSISRYWSSMAALPAATDSVIHNYLYALLKHCKGVYMQRKRDEAGRLTHLVEREVIQRLGTDHLLMAETDHLLGLIYQRVDQDKAIDYSLKALKTKRKHLNPSDNSIASTLDNLSGCYLYKQNFKTAITYSLQALEIRRALDPPDHKSLIGSCVNTSQVYFYLAEPEKTLALLKEADSLCDQHLAPDHSYKLLTNSHLSRIYNSMGDYELSLEKALNSLHIRKQKYGFSTHLEDDYDNICASYFAMGQLDKAVSYCDTVVQIIKMTGTKVSLSAAINNLGIAERNPHKSLAYINQAIALCPEDPECSEQKQATRYGNLATIYSAQGDFDSALNYLIRAKDILEKDTGSYGDILINTYRNLNLTYQKLGENDLAREYLNQAIELNRQLERKDHFVASLQRELANLLSENDELKEAEALIQQAIATEEEELGLTHPYTAKSYAVYADILHKKSKYDLAISYINKSIDAKSVSGKDYSNKVHEDYLRKIQIYESKDDLDSCRALLHKTLQVIGFDHYEEDGIRYEINEYELWHSLESYIEILKIDDRINHSSDQFLMQKIKTGIELIDRLRSSYFFESSELEFQKSVRSFYDWSLEKLTKIYQAHPSESRLALIFETMEKSKSIALNRRLKISESVRQNLVPADIISTEKRIMYQYEKTAKKYESTTSVDHDSLALVYAQEMFEMQREKESFLESLADEYPTYYEQRYQQKVIELSQLQALAASQDRAFIIYYWADSTMYALTITPDHTELNSQSHRHLSSQIHDFRRLLSDKRTIADEQQYKAQKSQYIQTAYSLCDLLFRNKANQALPEKLSIIADGPLVHLTFEALLTKSANANSPYRSLPYLIRDHNISYIGSATQFYQLQQADRPIHLAYQGYGPSYGQEKTISLTSLRGSDPLSTLIHNTKEIQQTASLFDGVHYLGDKATESIFKSQKATKGLLHLAMHASVNETFPMESYMSFAADSSSQEDGRLHVYEIAEMTIDKDLVVLSACETNVGDQMLGEGVLGIARAFQIASCPNLVMSHWLVDDQSASEMIFDFFKSIKDQVDPSTALRQAKLNYIGGSAEVSAHPSYWATFAYYGNPETNTDTSLPKIWIFGLAAGLLCLLFFYIFRK